MWAMLSWQSLGLIALACFVMLRLPMSENLFQLALNMLISAGLAMLGSHVSRVLEVGVWRFLPEGRRTATRALGLIVAALSVLFGGLFRWVAPEFLADVPLGMTLPIFSSLSVFAFLLLVGMGRQLPRYFVVLYLLIFGITVILTSLTFRGAFAFSLGSAALCAVVWIYASLTNLRAPAFSRRRFAWDLNFEDFLALADRGLSTGGSPVRKLLRSGRTGGGNLFVAVVVIALIAGFQGFTLGRLPMPDPKLLLAAPLSFAAIFATVLANQYARPAKRLWLCWANSRTELFRLVERMAWGDVCIVASVACSVAMGIAVYRGYDLTRVVALKLLIASVGLAITQAYVGLIYSAMHSRWMRLLVALLTAIGVLYGTGLWLAAFGASDAAGAGFAVPQLVAVLLVLVSLRYLALAAWRRIDWSHYRTAKK
jgi:hypothetical protein